MKVYLSHRVGQVSSVYAYVTMCSPICVYIYEAEKLPWKYSLSNDGRQLTIRDLCKSCAPLSHSDLQVIQCNASNQHGYDFATGYINVLGRATFT